MVYGSMILDLVMQQPLSEDLDILKTISLVYQMAEMKIHNGETLSYCCQKVFNVQDFASQLEVER